MTLLTTAIAFIFTLGVLVTVHEYGHYWAARRCGVKVLRFSVGFGKPLFKAVRGPDRTEWVVAAIPLGGYVSMLDERATSSGPIAPVDLPRAFNRQSVWRRSLIVVAGPVANLLLAIAVYWALALIGGQEPRAIVGTPAVTTPAARAGLTAGDTVVAFDGTEVKSWPELRWHLLKAAIERGDFELQVQSPQGVTRELQLVLRADDVPEVEGDVVGRLGFQPMPGPARLQMVAPGSPAERAGLKAGDEIVAIDGEPVLHARDVSRQVAPRPLSTLMVQVLREGARQNFSITTAAVTQPDGKAVGQLGVGFVPPPSVTVRYGPIDSLTRAVVRTWDTAIFSLRMLGRMITGEASWKNLSGPVTIADYAGKTASIGIVPFVSFLALVSISLGVLNLLPIPMLDGGHLLYYAAEVVRGSPPAQWVVDLGQRAGIAALVMLTALALYNDLARLLS